MAELANWQKEHLRYIEELNNRELLEEVISSAGGDDWDGAFTKRGWWEFCELKSELEKRLTNYGFLGIV